MTHCKHYTPRQSYSCPYENTLTDNTKYLHFLAIWAQPHLTAHQF